MTRPRWIQFGALLAVAFVLSVGAGALIGRQRSAPPVASVPTPTPALSGTATPTTAPPTASPVPTTTPTAAPPTIPPTTPTVPPSVPPSAPPVLDPATAEEFADDLLVAFQSGDSAYLLDRLHPLVFERYSVRQCRRHVNGLPPDPGANWTMLSATGPAPWDWVTDELTTTVQDAWTVAIEQPGQGEREVHFAPFDGKWRWFTDCTPSP